MTRPYAQLSPFALARGEATAGGGGTTAGVALPFNGALVKKSANQSIANNTPVILSWDVEEYDTDDIHDLVTNNSRMTVPAGVTRVQLTVNARWASNSTGLRDIAILKNGANIDGSPASRVPAANESEMNIVSPVLTVVAGDYFEVQVFQNSGAALDLITHNLTWFSIQAVEQTAPSVAFRGALVKPAADQTAKNFLAATPVAFDAEVYDTDGFHDNAVNNTRLTVPAGVTHVRLVGGAALNLVVVNDHIQLRLQANGTGAIPGLARTHTDVQSSAPSLTVSSGVIEVVEGDYFELLIDTATDTSITVTAAETWFAIEVVETAVVSGRPSLLHVRDEKADGTAGGTLTQSVWNIRDLNTVLTNEISGASLASNQITLSAGTYEITASAQGYLVNSMRIRLRDTTGAVTLISGQNANAHATASSQMGIAQVSGRFTLTVTSVLELQHWVQLTRAADGAGFSVTDTDEVEVYADVMIEKIS